MNRLIDLARALPTPDSVLTIAYTPIRRELPGRQPLELRVTAPAAGNRLPILILSHGFGPSKYIPSKDGYAPLARFWTERAMADIQPTHASSKVGGLGHELINGRALRPPKPALRLRRREEGHAVHIRRALPLPEGRLWRTRRALLSRPVAALHGHEPGEQRAVPARL